MVPRKHVKHVVAWPSVSLLLAWFWRSAGAIAIRNPVQQGEGNLPSKARVFLQACTCLISRKT